MIKKIVLALLFITTNILAQGDIKIFSVENDPKSDLPAVIEKTLEADGFYISANTEMNEPFKIQFQQSDYEVFHLLTVFHLKLSDALIKKYPDAGIFIPMGIGIYQAKGDKSLHASILTAEAQSKILGMKTVDPLLASIEKEVTVSLKKAMPKATVNISDDNALPAEGPLVSRFEMEVDVDDWADAKEELQMTIEDGFKPAGFVMSNYTEYNYILTEEGTKESPFDFYDTYSICKLKVIYNVAKTRPEAAAFAPCTLMVYKKKGDDKIVMGFPGVYNWMSSAHVEDKNAKEVLMKAQTDFEQILRDATE
ncbi:MAG: DUF302 domain-containing protein [Sulfurimonadaceae bacterium]